MKISNHWHLNFQLVFLRPIKMKFEFGHFVRAFLEFMENLHILKFIFDLIKNNDRQINKIKEINLILQNSTKLKQQIKVKSEVN